MRYSVFTTFHVEADSEDAAAEAVESALDLLFAVHSQDVRRHDAQVVNAATTRIKHITQEA